MRPPPATMPYAQFNLPQPRIPSMKRLIIVLLLVIFSAQGMGAAAGINVLSASRAFAHLAKNGAESKPSLTAAVKAEASAEQLKIFSIDEELSDYVVLELNFAGMRHLAPSLEVAAWIPASTILPRSPPPPRS